MKRILALVLGLVMAMVLLPALTACGTDDPAPANDYQANDNDAAPQFDFDELIMATYHGMVIRFAEQDVRPMGRVSRGVRGINLGPGDRVVSADNITAGEELLFITENGFGKSTRLSEFRSQSRGGKGLIGIRCTKRNGNVAGVAAISPGDEVMIISKDGVMIRCFTDDISSIGRATQGVKVMHLGDNDQVQTAAKVVIRDEDDGGADINSGIDVNVDVMDNSDTT